MVYARGEAEDERLHATCVPLVSPA
jgi:hypothetical protein